jgi:hypothetical protein
MNLLLALLLSVAFSSEAKDINGHLHGVYCQEGEVFYQEFDGERWLVPLNLSHSPEDSSHSPLILSRGEIVTVFWIEGHGEGAHLIMCKKLVGEWRWAPPMVIDTRGESEAREFLEDIQEGWK